MNKLYNNFLNQLLYKLLDEGRGGKIDSRIHKIFWYEFLNEFLTELLNETKIYSRIHERFLNESLNE